MKMPVLPAMGRMTAFNERVCEVVGSEPTLLEIEDWPLYRKSEMELISCIRNSFGEKRALIEAPCHAFESNETDLMVGMFTLTISFQWKATVFFPSPNLIIHNWEGDFLEFYCSQLAQQNQLSDLISEFSE